VLYNTVNRINVLIIEKGLRVSVWGWLWRIPGRWLPSRREFVFEEDLQNSIQELAEREGRGVNEMAGELLAIALDERLSAEEYLRRWYDLTAREQQVAALVCQNYSNRQIAEMLVISPETVKSHLRKALRKFGLKHKIELRQIFAGWDFQEWGS
jgi:DNA-binding CsgD family transcriptional regulator